MSHADERLTALLRETDPPARDPAFRLAVLERQARQSFRIRMAAVVGVGLAAAALLVVAGQGVTSEVAALSSNGVLPAAAIVLAVLSTGWGLTQMRRPL